MNDLEHNYHPETQNELEQALHEIESWEAEQKDLWGEALDELGNYLQAGGRYLISEKGTLQHIEVMLERNRGKRDDLTEGLAIAFVERTLPLQVLDQTADS